MAGKAARRRLYSGRVDPGAEMDDVKWVETPDWRAALSKLLKYSDVGAGDYELGSNGSWANN